MHTRRAGGERLGGNLTPFGRQNGISPSGCAPAAREGENRINHWQMHTQRTERRAPQKPRCLPLLGGSRQIPERFGSVAVPFFRKCSAQPVLFAFFR